MRETLTDRVLMSGPTNERENVPTFFSLFPLLYRIHSQPVRILPAKKENANGFFPTLTNQSGGILLKAASGVIGSD